jgi:hypothetical protein
MSGGPPDGFGDRPKALPEHQFGGPAGNVWPATGRSGQAFGQAKPEAE